MGSERWSSENNITFMNLYREQENLWNCFDKNYKNRDMRKASLEYIANEMSLVNTSEPNDTPSGSKILEDDVSRDIDNKTDNKSIDSSVSSLIKNKNPVQQCDEYDVIGKHVAIQLRELPLLDFIDAKDEIQQVFSRYRKKAIYARNTSAFSSYNTSSPTSYISLTSPGSSVPSDSFPGPVPISDRPAETVSRQPVQTVVGQPSNASYEGIHFGDPLVRTMIDADMNNMQ
ncbi:unnamed protein product [Acanthoscelides obtectus]|uniref:MADF domain-containing protein n=1 Tax=Acanthoscelides obtectus TaxID=200917 RepID=A0A9P0KIT2_ACAOB|nr:unnamed protein product [Acanthoscelides obtectus]CAK1626224.1 hypothetical protein AOBTE_LOCUS3692 [Acanthoscelides obtectus]